jgi:REP element-mobilizing transposase RayT
MPLSLAFVVVHVIFSTKGRRPVLDDSICAELYPYLSMVVRNAGCECYRVGGIADHVHLAIRMSRSTNLSKLVGDLKASSSKWLKTKSPERAKFAWQRGYGAFSVGPADLKALVKYIDAQEIHHRKRSFQDELRAFLKKYGVECDERYLWD